MWNKSDIKNHHETSVIFFKSYIKEVVVKEFNQGWLKGFLNKIKGVQMPERERDRGREREREREQRRSPW